MKKMIFGLVEVMILLAFTACSKEDEQVYAHYKYFGLEDINYVIGEESTVTEFAAALGNVMTELDGTYFTESTIKNKVQNVVRQYTPGVMQGTFHLKKAETEGGTYHTVASYTMELDKKYTTKAVSPEWFHYDFEYDLPEADCML